MSKELAGGEVGIPFTLYGSVSVMTGKESEDLDGEEENCYRDK